MHKPALDHMKVWTQFLWMYEQASDHLMRLASPIGIWTEILPVLEAEHSPLTNVPCFKIFRPFYDVLDILDMIDPVDSLPLVIRAEGKTSVNLAYHITVHNPYVSSRIINIWNKSI